MNGHSGPVKFEELDASKAIAEMRRGRLTSEDYIKACLCRIQAREYSVKAWSFIDPEAVLEEARKRDRQREEGRGSGPLHGVPVAIKDMIYTADMPTQHNSPLYEGYWPRYDAACVRLLKNAGAVIMGKAHTVEFASMGRLAPTHNPLDLERTPGGSSSGSAAAVADFMVPLSLGTQTGGSTIRPAAFCGLFGMKPTYSLIPVEGVRPYAPSLDTVGLMARTFADLQLLCQALLVIEEPPIPIVDNSTCRIGVLRTNMWSKAESSSKRAVLKMAEVLAASGIEVVEVDSNLDFDELTDAQNIFLYSGIRELAFGNIRSAQ